MKCLIMVRASTEAQTIEDQHREMVQFCIQEGYKEEELVFVEDKGASAIKLNDSYRLMIEQVKEIISSDPDINCFAVWELSRAFRNELVFQQVKQILVEKKIQFIVKNPYLKLLNPDGTVNSGMEIAVTLMATLAKQEMTLKQERFHRGKKASWEKGKAIGGNIKIGYKVNKDGYIVLDEEKAPFIRLVFELYSTGKYSVRTLFNELTERGYQTSYHIINKIVADKAYIDSPYEQMISKELWKKCEMVRKDHMLSIPKGKKYAFGSGIFKCSCCGRSMIPEAQQYRCWHHNKYSAPPHCDNGLTIRVENMDALLWWVASREEVKYRMKLDQAKEKDYQKTISVLEQKVLALKSKSDLFEYKKSKIIDLYIDDLITKEERDKRIKKLKTENQGNLDSILSYEEQIKSIQSLLDKKDTDDDLEYIVSLYNGVIAHKDLKTMQEIVHRHIKRVTTEKYWFGRDRDLRAVKENAQLIKIETVTGEIKKYIYIARKYKKHHFYFYRTDGKELPILHIKKIIRESEKSTEPRAFKKLSTW